MTEYYLDCEERDPAVWVGVPTQWPMPGFEKEFPDIPAWADTAANAIWEDSSITARPGEIDELAGILAYAADRFPKSYPGFEVFLHLPGPRAKPFPVYVGDVDIDGDVESELRAWTGVDDPNAVEPPIVEEFDSPNLGTGRRVLRYFNDPDDPSRGIIAALRYGWAVESLGLIASLFTVSPDPGQLIAAMDDIDALARCLRYVPDEG